jgi:hypothetical protein
MLQLLDESKMEELKGFVARRSSISHAAGANGSLATDVEQLLAAVTKVQPLA